MFHNFTIIPLFQKENHESLKSEKQRIDEISKHIYQLNKIQNEIEIFIDSKTEDKLKHAEERVKTQDDMINIFKNNKSNLEKKIASIKEDMTQQELSKRTLMDNIVLRRKEGELETLKNQWEHLSKCAKNFHYDKLLSSRQELRQEEKKLLKEVISSCLYLYSNKSIVRSIFFTRRKMALKEHREN